MAGLNFILRSVATGVFLLLLAGTATQAGAQEGKNLSPGHCRAEFRKCDRIDGACVWLGIPLDLDCDRNCQIQLMGRIQQKIGTGVRSSPSRPGEHGCVGYRPDLDGTPDGAMCLAEHLGYRYDPEGCNVAGWAYNVLAQ